MLREGDCIPDADVWAEPNKRVSLGELATDGRVLLLLFYLFDWSST